MRVVAITLFGFLILVFAGLTQAKEDWKVIEQPEYRLIFAQEIEAEAQRVANKLDYYLAEHQIEMPLNQSLRQIDVVLYSKSHNANGNVGLAPYRSHWFNQPSPMDRLEWYDALAVHEGRHIVQYNQLYDNRLGRALSVAFGQRSTQTLIGALLPTWYLEGDAVVSETTLTKGGRGRVAAFDLWFRTDLLSNPAYSYDRAMLGTGFDRVPYLSPYVLGYFLTSYMRTNYDDKLFDQVMSKMATFNTISFDGSIHSETGQHLNQIYQQAMSELKERWQTQLSELNLSPVTALTNPQKNHWQSFYPVHSQDEQTLAVRVDVNDGNDLVMIKNNSAKKLTAIPKSVAKNFYRGSKTRGIASDGIQTCWIAGAPHLTQRYKESADLWCWNPQAGLQQLTKGEKFTSVEISNNNYLVHRFNTDRSSEFVLLNMAGQTLKTFTLPIGSLAYDIRKAEHGFVFVLNGSNEDGIYKIDEQLTSIVPLITKTDATLRSPVATPSWLFYTSDRTGIDQPMAMSLLDGLHYQIATRPFGAYYLTLTDDQQTMVMADYSSNGQTIVRFDISNSGDPLPSWQKIETFAHRKIYAESLIRPDQTPVPAAKNYAVENYSVAANLWNPHSWGLYLSGAEAMANINSFDVLEKLSVWIAAGYNFEESEPLGSVITSYQLDSGPLLSSAVQHLIDGNKISATISQPYTWQKNISTNVLSPSVGVLIDTDEIFRITSAINFTTSQDTPYQAIDTPFGFSQSFYVDVSDDEEFRLLSESAVTLRGLTARQSFDINTQVQWLQTETSLLPDSPLFKEIESLDYSAQAAANYKFNLGPVGKSFTGALYLRNTEISANLRAQIQSNNWETALGISLAPSINLLRNTYLQVRPSMSTYYAPKTKEVTFLVGATIGNF